MKQLMVFLFCFFLLTKLHAQEMEWIRLNALGYPLTSLMVGHQGQKEMGKNYLVDHLIKTKKIGHDSSTLKYFSLCKINNAQVSDTIQVTMSFYKGHCYLRELKFAVDDDSIIKSVYTRETYIPHKSDQTLVDSIFLESHTYGSDFISYDLESIKFHYTKRVEILDSELTPRSSQAGVSVASICEYDVNWEQIKRYYGRKGHVNQIADEFPRGDSFTMKSFIDPSRRETRYGYYFSETEPGLSRGQTYLYDPWHRWPGVLEEAEIPVPITLDYRSIFTSFYDSGNYINYPTRQYKTIYTFISEPTRGTAGIIQMCKTRLSFDKTGRLIEVQSDFNVESAREKNRLRQTSTYEYRGENEIVEKLVIRNGRKAYEYTIYYSIIK